MERHLIAIATGVLGGAIPNNKSNIHPYLMGAILAILAVKVFVGDYDKGYSWTISDIGFVVLTGLEGVLGAAAVRLAMTA
jgi:hypothetical protein